MQLTKRERDSARAYRDEVWLWAASKEDCLWLKNVHPYIRCRVAGIVDRLRIDPQKSEIIVTITDGTGSLSARWAIVDVGPQLHATPGRGLILEGIPRAGSDGVPVMDCTYGVMNGQYAVKVEKLLAASSENNK